MPRTYNIIDADGHVLEPPNLWVEYIDPKFRDDAPRVITDENNVDRLWIAGRIFPSTAGGIGRAGTIGIPGSKISEARYLNGRKGGFNPQARIADMDLDA